MEGHEKRGKVEEREDGGRRHGSSSVDKRAIVCFSKEWESWSSQEQLDYQECDKNSLFGKLGYYDDY